MGVKTGQGHSTHSKPRNDKGLFAVQNPQIPSCCEKEEKNNKAELVSFNHIELKNLTKQNEDKKLICVGVNGLHFFNNCFSFETQSFSINAYNIFISEHHFISFYIFDSISLYFC